VGTLEGLEETQREPLFGGMRPTCGVLLPWLARRHTQRRQRQTRLNRLDVIRHRSPPPHVWNDRLAAEKQYAIAGRVAVVPDTRLPTYPRGQRDVYCTLVHLACAGPG